MSHIDDLVREIKDLKNENKNLRDAIQRRTMEPHEMLDIIAQAVGLQIGRPRWWDTTKEKRLKLLLSKVKALRYSKP